MNSTVDFEKLMKRKDATTKFDLNIQDEEIKLEIKKIIPASLLSELIGVIGYDNIANGINEKDIISLESDKFKKLSKIASRQIVSWNLNKDTSIENIMNILELNLTATATLIVKCIAETFNTKKEEQEAEKN